VKVIHEGTEEVKVLFFDSEKDLKPHSFGETKLKEEGKREDLNLRGGTGSPSCADGGRRPVAVIKGGFS